MTRAAPLCGNFRANFPDTLTDKPQTSDAAADAVASLSFKAAASATTAFSPTILHMGSEGKKISHEKKKKPNDEIHEMRISNFQTDTFPQKGVKSLLGFFLKIATGCPNILVRLGELGNLD